MNIRQRGLGRGLGALIPTRPETTAADPASNGGPSDNGPSGWPPAGSDTASAQPDAGPSGSPVGATFDELPITSIRPNPRQPRSVFDEDSMDELVRSIHAVGLLQPIVVRPLGDQTYELVMGERRWRACRQAGLLSIPAIVRQTGDDELLRDALLENLHRAQLNPLEEAAAYEQLLDDFGCTHDELAHRVGRSRPQISNTIRLLKLSAAVQRRVAAGVLSAGHARALLALDDPEQQDKLAARVIAEGISVRGLEELVLFDGDPAPKSTRITPPRAAQPELVEIAGRLAERLDTRCTVEMGRRKGKLVIEFASHPDLQRILRVLEPGIESSLSKE